VVISYMLIVRAKEICVLSGDQYTVDVGCVKKKKSSIMSKY
jgi:hypothetical protein